MNLKCLGLVLFIGAPSLASIPIRSDVSPHFDAISNYLDYIQEELWLINKEIHSNPELAFKEVKAHKTLTDYLESKEGWSVDKTVANLTTAFAAVFEGKGDGPVVSFNAEYDALPTLGHACGHNLIAMSSLGAALAAAEVLREQKLPGKVVLFGTPAEEGGSGKIQMLKAGVFNDYGIDVSLMSHPSPVDTPYAITFAVDEYSVEFQGQAAHASAAPAEGINAQDAMVLAYDAISMLRQQSASTDQVQILITSGGQSVNVISALATATCSIRSKDKKDLKKWTDRILKCFQAGSLATGATVNITRGLSYNSVLTNDILAESYSKWFTGLGGDLKPAEIDKLQFPTAATDQGDVSHAFPAIHPFFTITYENGTAPKGGPHTPDFEVASGSKKSFERALRAGKALAGTAVDVLTVDGLLDKIKEGFENQKRSC